MTLWFYVKTSEDPKTVGEIVCSFNYATGIHPEDKYTWIMEKGKDEGEEYWEMKAKYEGLKDLVPVGIVYRVGDTVVLSEVNDDLSPNVIDPLIGKYGFDNVKWIVVPKPE